MKQKVRAIWKSSWDYILIILLAVGLASVFRTPALSFDTGHYNPNFVADYIPLRLLTK